MKPLIEETVAGQSDADLEVQEIIESLCSSNENTQEEKDFFRESIDVRRVKKGVLLLKEGQFINTSYYLFKGCVREYYLKDGEEKTVAFYTAGDIIMDGGSTLNNARSRVSWECVCESIVSV